MENQCIISDIIQNIEKVIIGKKKVVEMMMIALLCESHVLIEDVPGVGKTTLISALAKSISASYKRIQFTPDVMPSDITGFSMYNPKKESFEYQSGALMSQIVLADEINRTPPKTQSSLLEAMEEGQVTVDGTTHKLPEPFIVFATQNPIEYLGTYPLPEAQLDRFIMKLSVGYPDLEQEQKILDTYNTSNPLSDLKAVASVENIIELQNLVKEIHIGNEVKRYIVEIVSKTRNQSEVILGASPRGSLFLMMAAKAWAFYKGRNYVKPDDVQELAIPVLAHRIALRQEAKLKNMTAEFILRKVIRETPVPTGVSNEE
jgi:MoxR-like ATPase